MNLVVLLGNLTADPVMKYMPSGTAIADFTLAVDGATKNGDKWEPSVDFLAVTVFGKTAENCAEHLVKGSKVLLEGKLKQDRWKDKEGREHSKIKILGMRVQFLGLKKHGQGVYQPKQEEDKSEAEIPF